MLRSNLMKGLLALVVIMFTGTTCYAQQYYNGYDPYYNYNANNYNTQVQQNPYYNPSYYVSNNNANPYSYNPYYNQPVYDPNTQTYYTPPVDYQAETKKQKLKRALTYGALGAGAGYLFSKNGSRGKNTAIGAGLGAALGLLLNKY